MKFGGKSLDCFKKVQKICKNIKKIYKNDKKIIIVVSAIGKTTDNLIETSKNYYKSNYSSRELDVLLSTGETQSSALFALALNSCGVPAKSLQAFQLNISTFGDFQNSRISYINKQPILECFENNQVVVVPGFQGINKNGEITTLGRGGSDTTAAALGAIFDCNTEIYSDFDGVFYGDPRCFNYKKIKTIDYDSMINIASTGAKVLEARAVEIAKGFNTQIICKQSSNQNLSGSTVSNIEKSFVSISKLDNLCQITINFSQNNDIILLSKNVLNVLKNFKFYNFEINNNKITFYIDSLQKDKIEYCLASKLKLLKNN